VFGGTYDPVHMGHLNTAQRVHRLLNSGPVYLLPCFQAVHKSLVGASAKHRLKMLELACEAYPELQVDAREIKRQSASYTYDTVLELKKDYPAEKLVLVMGYDTALGLPTWKNSDALAKLCSILVVNRSLKDEDLGDKSLNDTTMENSPLDTGKGIDAKLPVENYVQQLRNVLAGKEWCLTSDVERLHRHDCGQVCMVEFPPIDISSTDVRQALSQIKRPGKQAGALEKSNLEEKPKLVHMVPKSVLNYIFDNHLYL